MNEKLELKKEIKRLITILNEKFPNKYSDYYLGIKPSINR